MGTTAAAADADGTSTASSNRDAAAPDRELARQLFSAAVSLTKAGRYAAAKALFLEAYAAAPHYLVLYNIAQSELRLGERVSAANDLRRFLDEGGSELDATRRAAIEAEIESINHDTAREVATPADSPPISVSPAPVAASVQAEPPPRPLEAATSQQPERPRSNAERISDPPNGITPAPWTYTVVTGGFALLGGAVGIYVWNDGRYQRWREENAALLALKQSDLAKGIAPAADASVRDRARRNDERLASVKRFDPVPVVTAAVGLAAMGLGLWALIDTRDDGVWHVFGDPSQLELGARLIW